VLHWRFSRAVAPTVEHVRCLSLLDHWRVCFRTGRTPRFGSRGAMFNLSDTQCSASSMVRYSMTRACRHRTNARHLLKALTQIAAGVSNEGLETGSVYFAFSFSRLPLTRKPFGSTRVLSCSGLDRACPRRWQGRWHRHSRGIPSAPFHGIHCKRVRLQLSALRLLSTRLS